jgi:hypothetical protein
VVVHANIDQFEDLGRREYYLRESSQHLLGKKDSWCKIVAQS